jgi:hypothetical protein
MTEGDKLEQTPPSHGGDMSDLSSPIDVDSHRIDGLTLADAWMLASSTYGCAPTPLSRRSAMTAIPARRRRIRLQPRRARSPGDRGTGAGAQRCRRLVPLRMRRSWRMHRARRDLREAPRRGLSAASAARPGPIRFNQSEDGA